MSDDGLPLGWWTEDDALLWAERTHAPVHLTGQPFAVWEAQRNDGPPPDDGVLVDRLRALGLLGDRPAPREATPAAGEQVVTIGGVDGPVLLPGTELAEWSATPAPAGSVATTRCRRVPAGWVVANAANDVPIIVARDRGEALPALAALSHALAQPDPAAVHVPLIAVHRDGTAVLVAPALLADPTLRLPLARDGHTVGRPISRLVGIRPAVVEDGVGPIAVAGVVLDQTWAAENPAAGSLLPRWALTCLLAAANPPEGAGRYALLDAAGRLAALPVVLLPLDQAAALPRLISDVPR